MEAKNMGAVTTAGNQLDPQRGLGDRGVGPSALPENQMLTNRQIAQRARRSREIRERNAAVEGITSEIVLDHQGSPVNLAFRTPEEMSPRETEGRNTVVGTSAENQLLSNRQIAQRARRARESEIRERKGKRVRVSDESILDHRASKRSLLFITPDEIRQRELEARRNGAGASTDNQLPLIENDTNRAQGGRGLGIRGSVTVVPPAISRTRIRTSRQPSGEPEIDVNSMSHLHNNSASLYPIPEFGESVSRSSALPVLNASSNILAASAISERHYLGNMNIECEHCGALHWISERLTNSTENFPHFGSCCLQGKIRLPLLRRPPPALQALYDGSNDLAKAFRKNIRGFNAAFAFTSLGVRFDNRLIPGRGPRAFTIMGELRHRTGSLLPEEGHVPSYSQLYIYDPAQALQFRRCRNTHLDVRVLQILQDIIVVSNLFASRFRSAYDILQTQNSGTNMSTSDIHAYLRYTAEHDRRRYNLPSEMEIAVVLPGDGTEFAASRDIILYLKSGHGFTRINECHAAYLPLHYVLFFPYGELGWSPDLRHATPSARNRLTQLEYYCYRLFQRHSEYSAILRGCNLFQEFLCDAWAVTEQNRLRFIVENQSKIRAELYKGLVDVATSSSLAPDQVGRRIILPSSHTCSPRHLFEILQDSMAITRYNKHPDVFLTMTANPNWREIKESLLPHQAPTDRPDLIARVFELKRKALMNEVKRNRVFGLEVAHVFTIEFQKRGLPHMHALFYLQHDDKIRSVDQVDRIITAEFPDPEVDPVLFQTVISCMIHGPCGLRNPHAPCMESGSCKKKYPKEFVNSTVMDVDGYPIYRRRDNHVSYEKNGLLVDNRDVVPHNPYLTKLFNCHINVEVCAGIRCVKYIHKYIFKGHDRTTLVLDSVDEVKQYLDARYIGSPEAAWRLFENPMHEEVPNVIRLVVHLPGMHQVLYNADDSMENILRRASAETTKLTAFFDCCYLDERARTLTYQEMPQFYRWYYGSWIRRQRGFAIGRMYFVPPNAGERFYLRLLLTVVKGPTSFYDLRTVGDVLYRTFREACIARGLLEDDHEWVQCLREAATMQTGYQLRRLFCIILSECLPTEPEKLWTMFSDDICDDLPYILRISFGILNPSIDQIRDYGLHMLDNILNEYGKSLRDFPHMPLPTLSWNVVVGNKLIVEHSRFDLQAQRQLSISNCRLFNTEQRHAHDTILESVINGYGKLFFLSGAAGTGKTFVYNSIAATCRSVGYIVLMVASSGIASLLLSNGRTAHSTFKIPIDILDNSICGFKKQSDHADLFRHTKLLIWDEVTMQHKFAVEAVDRSLQDACNNDNLFGGITVVLGGDFKQCLPVIPKGSREQVVGASLRRSYIWNNINVLTLSQNMRLDRNDQSNILFEGALKEIGSNPAETVELPTMINYVYSIGDLLTATYPNLNVVDTVTSAYLMDRLILAARNDDVSAINSAALDIFPGIAYTYLAADKMADEDANVRSNINQYPNEYLNTLEPPGLSPFMLKIKVGSPVILLRNLAPKDGLCNGTRLKVERCTSRCIQATILTGDNVGKSVFIPRIPLTPTSFDFPFKMTRRQFPIRLAYAITINKSQGQSVKHVGIDLREQVFSHGQLYVALSRCTRADHINILMSEGAGRVTKNIVYPEVLI